MCDFADVDRKGNMKKLSGAKVAFLLFSVMTVACVSGSIGGTLAWYAYSTRALVSYSGTSVSETALLQIGICSDVPLTGMPTGISSVTYAGDSNYYYFASPGRGMTYDVIEKYLAKKGYATNELQPTTSGSYASGSDNSAFSLKQSPNEMIRGNTTPALTKDYVKIPFVFRIETDTPGTYYDGKELWLTKAVARAATSGDGEVYKALRVFVDRDAHSYGAWKVASYDVMDFTGAPDANYGHEYCIDTLNNDLYKYDSVNDEWNLIKANIDVETSEPDVNNYNPGEMYLKYIDSVTYVLYEKASSDFIFNPSAESVGQTRVGGVLNIAKDAYFDYDASGEILYGEYDAAALDLLSATGYSGSSIAYDVNGVGNDTPSTFVAKHNAGTKYYADIAGNDNLFKHAQYESLSSIAPARDSSDYLSNADPDHPTSVCTTRAADHYLGRVNLTIYLEGWDFSVVDKEVSHGFDLGLTFEMSRL